MAKTLLNKRKGPFHLKPLQKGGKVRKWAAGTTMKFDDAEAAGLLLYKDVVELTADGKQVGGPAGLKPVPAGAGLAGKATVPAASPDAEAAKK